MSATEAATAHTEPVLDPTTGDKPTVTNTEETNATTDNAEDTSAEQQQPSSNEQSTPTPEESKSNDKKKDDSENKKRFSLFKKKGALGGLFTRSKVINHCTHWISFVIHHLYCRPLPQKKHQLLKKRFLLSFQRLNSCNLLMSVTMRMNPKRPKNNSMQSMHPRMNNKYLPPVILIPQH
ncbi:hypothetical protein K492DRAFT_75511 [Lichtheimia hyalospora FSU 10163]|nr:hypothetical protein K492DRAFT_75511 [Lichtheimia hyalospora FSU 10163]